MDAKDYIKLMSGYSNYISWLVTLFIAALLSIPFSIFANLFTPNIKDWLAKKSIISATKRIKKIEAEMNMINKYISSPISYLVFISEQNNFNYTCIITFIISTIGFIFFVLAVIFDMSFANLKYVIFRNEIVYPDNLINGMKLNIRLGMVVAVIICITFIFFNLHLFYIKRINKKIRNFPEYKRQSEILINELKERIKKKE